VVLKEIGCEEERWMELAQNDMVQMQNRIPSRESTEDAE
jgi:hypothetical protein